MTEKLPQGHRDLQDKDREYRVRKLVSFGGQSLWREYTTSSAGAQLAAGLNCQHSHAFMRELVVFLARGMKPLCFSRRRRQQRQRAPNTKIPPAAPKRYTTTCISWSRNSVEDGHEKYRFHRNRPKSEGVTVYSSIRTERCWRWSSEGARVEIAPARCLRNSQNQRVAPW